ncbi:MAG TPA: XrtA system polysaccharide deacetylase [Terriglobales bacterium]|nr:XrtA system polysaccharide deacetylase [Terriglobales bacterium]
MISSSNPTVMNALTIDVEDYFHTEAASGAVSRDQWPHQPTRVEASTLQLLQMFDRHSVKATLFILGWVAERFPALIRQAADAGHEIACHSYWHRAIFRLTPDEFREDTKRAKAAIEDAAGTGLAGYRAPSFSMVSGTEWALDILAELGFLYDSSVNPIRHDFYGNASAPRQPHKVAGGALWELPIATVRVAGQNLPMGGGAYLRIFPLRYMQWGLKQLREEGSVAMFYLHPWEIDPEQPRLPLGMKSRLRQYTNLRQTQSKLESLLSEFSFGPAIAAYPELGGNAGALIAKPAGRAAMSLSPEAAKVSQS